MNDVARRMGAGRSVGSVTEPYGVPRTESWTENDLRVVLARPFGGGGPVPLVLLLDGQSLFLTTVEHSRTVSLVTEGALPPVAVAGVWRETASPLDYVSTRFRDFTPHEWVLPEPFAADNAQIRHGTGGAAGLLQELEGRVLPAIRERIEIGEIAIGGWSLSGLFATWAWRERPDVLSHLIAISPSLWWCDARLLDEGLAPRVGARALVSAGEREEGDMALVWPSRFADPEQRARAAMVRNAEALGRQCVAAGVDTATVIFPDEHHVTVAPASIARALHHLFATA